LLSDTVAATLGRLATQQGEEAVLAQRASALIALASSGDDVSAVFEALADPAKFPGLLHAIATRPGPAGLLPAAFVAYTAADTEASAATALFYYAVALSIAGDQEQAAAAIKQARALAPAQVSAWINEAAQVGGRQGAALALIPLLTAPAEPAKDTEHHGTTPAEGESDDV
jgi:tetratricopeptide (TPR) repeat protein